MRVLALSDIHGNVRAIHEIREREPNRFDAVVVAGDLGNTAAAEILTILGSFNCPVLYIYGNWDDELDYNHTFAPNTFHLHTRPFPLGGVSFVGFSGVPINWGKNPFAQAIEREVNEKHKSILSAYDANTLVLESAASQIEAEHELRVARLAARTPDRRRTKYRLEVTDLERRRDSLLRRAKKQRELLTESVSYQTYLDERQRARSEVANRNRLALICAISESGINRSTTIVVTHDRLTRTSVDMADIPLFLFGHQHGFYDRRLARSRFANVSVLDNPITVLPKAYRKSPSVTAYRNLNNGNYAVIEGKDDGSELEIRPIHFAPNTNYFEVQPFVIMDAPWSDDI